MQSGRAVGDRLRQPPGADRQQQPLTREALLRQVTELIKQQRPALRNRVPQQTQQRLTLLPADLGQGGTDLQREGVGGIQHPGERIGQGLGTAQLAGQSPLRRLAAGSPQRTHRQLQVGVAGIGAARGGGHHAHPQAPAALQQLPCQRRPLAGAGEQP